MARVLNIIEQLEEKAQALIAQNKELKSKINRLASENEALKNQVEKQQQQIALGAVYNGTNSEEELKKAKQLEKQLGQYIQDIDRCIEWLEQN